MDSRLTKRVLEFWFYPKYSDTYGKNLKIWWKKDPDFDEEVAARFRDHFEGAERGALDGLADDARGSLALVILLDQFPRNMFRGTARAFGTDAKALAISEKAIERACFDRTLIPAERAQDDSSTCPGSTSRVWTSRSAPSACSKPWISEKCWTSPSGTGISSPASAAFPTAITSSAGTRRLRNGSS